MSGDAVADGTMKKYAVCCTCGALIAHSHTGSHSVHQYEEIKPNSGSR
jgi:hypothetical protein